MADTPLFTPSMMDAQIQVVEGGLRKMMPIIQGSDKLEDDLKTGFLGLVREWDTFKSSLNVITKALNSTWDTVQSFKQRMYDWADEARKQGVNTYTTNPSPAPGKTWLSAVPWWVWAGGAFWFVYNLHPLRTAHSVRSLIPSKKKK